MRDSFKDLTYDELLKKRNELRKVDIDTRFKTIVGHVENPLETRILRKKIARVNTIIHEYALGIRKS